MGALARLYCIVYTLQQFESRLPVKSVNILNIWTFPCAAAAIKTVSLSLLTTLKTYNEVIQGYIDIGYGCWRRNVLVTIMRCWWKFWPFWSPTFTIFLHKCRVSTSQRCHQHRNSATNIAKWSTTLSYQHYHIINITVTLFTHWNKWKLKFSKIERSSLIWLNPRPSVAV